MSPLVIVLALVVTAGVVESKVVSISDKDPDQPLMPPALVGVWTGYLIAGDTAMKRGQDNVPGLGKEYPEMQVQVDADGQFFGSISPVTDDPTGEGIIESHGSFTSFELFEENKYWGKRNVVSNGVTYDDCWIFSLVYSAEDPTSLERIDGFGSPYECPKTPSEAVYHARFDHDVMK